MRLVMSAVSLGNYCYQISADQDSNRDTKIEVLRRSDWLLPLLETVYSMSLLHTEAYGPPTEEESSRRRRDTRFLDSIQ
jgi:hypothetical protein